MAGSDVVPTMFSVYDPLSIQRMAFKRHGKRPNFMSLLDTLGQDFNSGINAPVLGHYELNNWGGRLLKVGSIVTPSSGAGNSMVVALHTDNMFTPGVTVSGSAAKASDIRPTDVVLLADGKLARVLSKNTGVDPHRVTIEPLDETCDLDDVVTAGVAYSVVTNLHARGSSLPQGFMPTSMKYTNEFAIVKEAFAADGSELTNQTFIQIVPTGDGTVVAVMEQEAMDRWSAACAGVLVWGEENTNINDTGTKHDYDVKVSWTEGLMPWRAANSYEEDYDLAAFTLDDVKEVASTLEVEELGTREVLSLAGHEYKYLIDETMHDFFDGSLTPALLKKSVSSYNLSLDDWQPILDQDFIAWLDFQSIRAFNFQFHYRMMHEFVAPYSGGAAAYEYKNAAIYLPLSKVKDRQSGVQQAAFGYHWKENPTSRYSRKMVVSPMNGAGVAGIGGISPTAVDTYDWAQTGMVSEIAFRGACPNKLLYHKKQA